jgi:hypothetical protein
MVELPSALLDADLVGQFLTGGGDAAYMFGYGPNWPVNQHLACAGYGNMMLQQADPEGQATARMPAYWFARMLTTDWTRPGHGLHAIYPVSIEASGPWRSSNIRPRTTNGGTTARTVIRYATCRRSGPADRTRRARSTYRPTR